jgi:hypothetical protein
LALQPGSGGLLMHAGPRPSPRPLQAGAAVHKPTTKPYAGDTALRIALEAGAREVAAVLRAHGAEQ